MSRQKTPRFSRSSRSLTTSSATLFSLTEKNALPVGQQVGNDVDDGLALARSRRPVDDEILAGSGGRDRAQLTVIGGQNRERRVKIDNVVKPAAGEFRVRRKVRGCRLTI